MTQQVEEIDVDQLEQWMQEEDLLLIDVREKMEFSPEHIQGAVHVPTSKFDPKAIPTPDGRRVIFYCQAGVRSFNAARRWSECDDCCDTCYSLKGGIAAWKNEGLPTRIDNSAGVSVMRQVYAIIGVLILLGSMLTAWVEPQFVWMTGVTGALLLLASLTGTCMLAMLVSKLPWNQ